MSVSPLADWVLARRDLDPSIKTATLDVCRLSGVPAHDLVAKLIDDPDESVRIAALQAAERWGVQGLVEKLSARAANPDVSLPERIALAMTLRTGGPAAFDALAGAYKAFGNDPGFGPIALRALVDCDRGKAKAIAIEALASPVAELRREAIQALGESPATAADLGKAYLAGKLGRSDLPNVLAALRRHGYPELSQLAEEIRTSPPRVRAGSPPTRPNGSSPRAQTLARAQALPPRFGLQVLLLPQDRKLRRQRWTGAHQRRQGSLDR